MNQLEMMFRNNPLFARAKQMAQGKSENELKQVPGEFTPSPFVKKITGVDNVCERSAVFASGNGSLLQKKNGENGVTTAVAAREWRIHFE